MRQLAAGFGPARRHARRIIDHPLMQNQDTSTDTVPTGKNTVAAKGVTAALHDGHT